MVRSKLHVTGIVLVALPTSKLCSGKRLAGKPCAKLEIQERTLIFKDEISRNLLRALKFAEDILKYS